MTAIKFIICLTSLTFISCSKQNSYDVEIIGDSDVQRVLSKAIDAHGGWEILNRIERLSFTKKTILYLQDDSIESAVEQRQEFQFYPELEGKITWQDSLGEHLIFYSENDSYVSLNGNKVPNSTDRARTTFFSNYFVLLLPFKFADPGTTLSYEGKLTLAPGKEVEVLKASYAPEKFENHSTSDVWYLHIDPETGFVVSNLVYHAPTYAYIQNLETTEEFPLRMNQYRQTWRTDKSLEKEYLRGEFWYTNYKFDMKPSK